MKIRQFPEQKTFIELAQNATVIPVCTEILADMETPVSLLQKAYGGSGPVFLLESVQGGERWGRYSFLGFSAHAELRVLADDLVVTRAGGQSRQPHGGDPLTALRRWMSAYRPAEVPGLPRFWGGLVGYFSYEMVSFLEDIPNRLPPEEPLAHLMLPDALMIVDNIRNTLLLVALAFVPEPAAAPAAWDEACARLAALEEIASRPLPRERQLHPDPTLVLTPHLEPERFREHVRQVKEEIRAGEIIQAVIAQDFSCPAPADTLALYRAQRYINPSPYLYFLHLGDTALVGSSPETMVRLENGVATLRPIAGTRPRGASAAQDRSLADELLRDEKERAEHLMLVDLGRNDLGRVARTGTVQVTDLMQVERYSHVMHLVSNIACDLEADLDAWDLFRATFPAGTLSGAPKVRAMEIIAEHELSPRGPYGGAVGYVGFGGNMDLAITIRTAILRAGRLTVRAGAGIVADSQPESERIETVNKAGAIQRALELINHGQSSGR
jgi:anthranilate synthase component 1